MSQELLQPLQSMRDQLRERLFQRPEYRAIQALERSITEISEIFESAGELRTAGYEDATDQQSTPKLAVVREQDRMAADLAETIAARAAQSVTSARAAPTPYVPAQRVSGQR